MRTAIAILTYNRVGALKETLSGLRRYCANHRTAIFEDCGQRDGTETFLRPTPPNDKSTSRPDLMALKYDAFHIGDNVEAFLGTVNLGVTGNSNRALKWFSETDCDHLILMNDDLHVLGDFVNFYVHGHEDLSVGMFSFCDFTHHPSYQWMTVNSRGYRVKLCPRMTGIMVSMKRAVLDKIGYFDARFGKFGEEHCDYMNRARLARFVDLDGQMQPQIDLEATPPLLKHQEVETSVTGAERQNADQEAARIMSYISKRYGLEPIYRPFCLRRPKIAAGHVGLGIPVDNLGNYTFVDSPA
jgi:glycosyltransferase involved in cell wall biosynthesis